jgi:hypothetical protein
MNIRTINGIPTMLVLLAAAGCTDAESPPAQAPEPATSTMPVLTATVPPTAGELTEQARKPEAQPPALEETPSVEEADPFVPTLKSVDGITINRLMTAPSVEDREPVAASSVFGPSGETVYAFLDVSNESADEQTLLVHFIGPQEQVGGGVELHIPPTAPRWRTWAYTKHAATPGLWRVEIRSTDGTLLGALPFEVESAR